MIGQTSTGRKKASTKSTTTPSTLRNGQTNSEEWIKSSNGLSWQTCIPFSTSVPKASYCLFILIDSDNLTTIGTTCALKAFRHKCTVSRPTLEAVLPVFHCILAIIKYDYHHIIVIRYNYFKPKHPQKLLYTRLCNTALKHLG